MVREESGSVRQHMAPMAVAEALGELPTLRRDCEQGGATGRHATASRLANNMFLLCPFQGQAIINMQ